VTDPSDPIDQAVAMANAARGGFNTAIGLNFTKVTMDEICAEIVVDDIHRQPYGIVHGGVYCSMIEVLCSTGAAVNVWDSGRSAVGMENSTAFLKATRGGKLIGRAIPVKKGRTTHVWEATVTNDEGKPLATGRVRMAILEKGAEAGGKKVELEV
jgi:uncharacterized protein (TIGR00369 family)